jgi:tetratricopeptide (TPR) repeat protein
MSEQEEQSWEHLRTAENLRYEGRMEEAIAEYTTAISFNPNFAGVYTMRAAAYGETGQHDKALADLNKAVRLDPEFATAYDNRAPTYISLGMDAEAEQDVKRVARLGDDTSELRNLIEERKGQRSQSSP